VKAKRFFVSCFDVTPDFGMTFEYQKRENPIKYLEAGFNPDQRSGDFFIEFEEQIHDNELELCFEAQRAKGINVLTFPNDGGKAASDALLHVMALQNKHGVKISRGVFPSSLKKMFDEQKAAQDKRLMEQEVNLKTLAAEKISMEEFRNDMANVKEEVHGIGEFQKVKLEDISRVQVKLEDSVQSIENGVQSIENGVQSQKDNIEDIKQKVCDVIAELQNQVKHFKDLADYKTRQCDVQEAKTAAQTRNVNQQKDVIADKENEIQALRKREEAGQKREESLREKIKELEGTLQVFKAMDQLNEMIQAAQQDRVFARTERAELKQSIAEVQESARSLGAVLAQEEERAAKRQRA
jgi:hypothetical protein